MRRKEADLNLITFGLHTYSSDSRYSLEYQAPNDWQLLIQFANERDDGHYECQVSSHPPLVLLVYLTVVGEYPIQNHLIMFWWWKERWRVREERSVQRPSGRKCEKVLNDTAIYAKNQTVHDT